MFNKWYLGQHWPVLFSLSCPHTHTLISSGPFSLHFPFPFLFQISMASGQLALEVQALHIAASWGTPSIPSLLSALVSSQSMTYFCRSLSFARGNICCGAIIGRRYFLGIWQLIQETPLDYWEPTMCTFYMLHFSPPFFLLCKDRLHSIYFSCSYSLYFCKA